MRTAHPFRHVTHGITMTLSPLLAFVGFRLMPLTDATAISFLRPLLVTLLAGLLLRETVRLTSWIAVLLGFAGVLVMLRPGAGIFDQGAIYSLGAAFIGALNMLQQRRLSLIDPTIGIVFWYRAMSSLVLLPTLAVCWVTPTPGQLAGLIVMGLAGSAIVIAATVLVWLRPVRPSLSA